MLIRPARPVQVDRRPRSELADLGGEVSERLDGELHLLTLGARRERKGMLRERKGRTVEGEPAELSRLEAEFGGRRRLERERRRLAALCRDALETPRARQCLARLEQPHPDQQQDERARHQGPKHLLPDVAYVLVDEEDMP